MRYKFKCKLKDLIDDLINGYDVTSINFDTSGIGIILKDALKENGVQVNYKEVKREKTLKNFKRRITEVLQMEWNKGLDYILKEIEEIYKEEDLK